MNTSSRFRYISASHTPQNPLKPMTLQPSRLALSQSSTPRLPSLRTPCSNRYFLIVPVKNGVRSSRGVTHSQPWAVGTRIAILAVAVSSNRLPSCMRTSPSPTLPAASTYAFLCSVLKRRYGASPASTVVGVGSRITRRRGRLSVGNGANGAVVSNPQRQLTHPSAW